MSEREIIQPEGWPKPPGYSHAIAATGRVIALAGQIGWDPQTSEFSDDFVAQVRAALQNVVTVLEAAHAAPSDVVRMTWFITDRRAYLDNRHTIGAVYREVFGRHYPAMSVVVVAGLLEEKAQIEIEATAVI